MLLAMTVEEQWDLGLLAINVIALLVGIPVAVRLATAPNGVFRMLWPLFGMILLGTFAVFIYYARTNVKF